MSRSTRFSASLALGLLCLGLGASVICAQAPLKTIQNPQGGTIVYGVVDGATTQGVAMGRLLHSLDNDCGERPRLGNLFRVRGSNSIAVFFSVNDHTAGNTALAGLLIATPTAPNRIEAAMVRDEATRFRRSMNPLLKQLFSVWHPGGNAQASDQTPTGGAATVHRSAKAQPLHQVWNQDHSALLGIPDGWQMKGNGGTTMVYDPNFNVILNINLCRRGTNPSYAQPYGRATGMAAPMVYPSKFDPVRGFPGFFQEFWRVNNQRADFRIEQIQPMQGGCVHAVGHGLILSANQPMANVQEKDYFEMDVLMCHTQPGPMGSYGVSLSISEIAPRVADQERATVAAILSSYQVNQAVVAGEASAIAAPVIRNIHEIGAMATARMAEADREHDIQHADFDARQDNLARRNQAFDNYILDQTVLQNNDIDGHGTVGHGTVWTSTADALVKYDPNRYEIVNPPGFWQGTDYHNP